MAESPRGEEFEQLFRAHYVALHDFIARYVISPDIAADLTQDVFLDAWSRWDTQLALLPPREVVLYLYSAARHRALNFLSHTRVERTYATRVTEAFGADEGSLAHADDIDANAIAQIARRVVDAMPERMRLVYTMSRRDGLSYAEIAQVLGISVNTVKTQMGRALEQLREALGPLLAALIVYCGR